MCESMPVFIMASLVKMRSIVDVCPPLSSLVGMFSSFLRLKVRPWSHSSIHPVYGDGVVIPSSQARSLMFQLPAMTMGMGQLGIWSWRQSAIHLCGGSVSGSLVLWLYMFII